MDEVTVVVEGAVVDGLRSGDGFAVLVFGRVLGVRGWRVVGGERVGEVGGREGSGLVFCGFVHVSRPSSSCFSTCM